MIGEWFVYILMTLDVAASISYLIHGDIPRTIYWLCAALLTATTLYMR